MTTWSPRAAVWPAVVLFAGCAHGIAPEADEQSLTTQFGNTAATSTIGADGAIETLLSDRAESLPIATLAWDPVRSERTFRFTDPETHRIHDASDFLTYEPSLTEMNDAVHDLWLFARAPTEHENVASITMTFIEGTSRSWFTGNGNICTVLEDPIHRLLAASLYESVPRQIRIRLDDDVESRHLEEFHDVRPDVQSMGLLLHELWLEGRQNPDDPAF